MWNSPGDLLKIWREQVVELSLRDVVERSSVTRSTLSDWENNRAQPDLAELERVYVTGNALTDLYMATNTVLDPQWNWVYNFQIPESALFGGPVWAWLRPGPTSPNRVRAHVRWGPVGAKVDEVCDERGIFLTCRVSAPHPAVFISWDADPGWANFGRGKLKPDKLGIIAHSELRIVDVLETSEAVRRLMKAGLDWLSHAVNDSPEEILGDGTFIVRCLKNFMRRGNDSEVHRAVEPPAVHRRDPWHQFDHREYLELRRKLGLSRDAVVHIVNTLDQTTSVDSNSEYSSSESKSVLSKDKLKYFEEQGGSRVSFLASRLDRAYRADGHTCREIVEPTSLGERNGQSLARVAFPDHWVGPVVVTVTNSSEEASEGQVTLTWGPWMASLIVASGRGVTCRKDAPQQSQLEIEYPLGWNLRTEIGYDPSAVDINNDIWRPKSKDAGTRIIGRNYPIFRELWRRAYEDS